VVYQFNTLNIYSVKSGAICELEPNEVLSPIR
jgi:hypothetical protein